LTFLRSLASSEANPERCSPRVSPRLRVSASSSISRTPRDPDPDGTVGVSPCPGDCGRRLRAASEKRVLRAMRVYPPEYQHLHSRSPKHFRAILINTRKAIALPNPRVWFTARFHHFRGLQLHLFSPAFSAAKLAKPCSVTPT